MSSSFVECDCYHSSTHVIYYYSDIIFSFFTIVCLSFLNLEYRKNQLQFNSTCMVILALTTDSSGYKFDV